MARGATCAAFVVVSAVAGTAAYADPAPEWTGPVLDYSGRDIDGTFHYYVDDEGRFHFTNRPELVPARYRLVPITLFVAPED